MNITFSYCKLDSCGIKVTDTSTYLDSSTTGQVFQQFKASEVYCVDVLEKHIIGSDSTYTTKWASAAGSSEFSSLVDCWYTVHHIVLPTKEYFDTALAAGGVINTYSGFYYTDGTKFYLYANNTSTEVTITEVVTRNVENTSILKYEADYFSICNLNACLIKLIEITLNKNIKCQSSQLVEDTFNRDLVWMAIYVIKYYVESGDLESALILLNKLQSCNGVCNYVNNTYNGSGCGCKQS
jgi:hypothetical protein